MQWFGGGVHLEVGLGITRSTPPLPTHVHTHRCAPTRRSEKKSERCQTDSDWGLLLLKPYACSPSRASGRLLESGFTEPGKGRDDARRHPRRDCSSPFLPVRPHPHRGPSSPSAGPHSWHSYINTKTKPTKTPGHLRKRPPLPQVSGEMSPLVFISTLFGDTKAGCHIIGLIRAFS